MESPPERALNEATPPVASENLAYNQSFKVIQGHRGRYQWKAGKRLLISN